MGCTSSSFGGHAPVVPKPTASEHFRCPLKACLARSLGRTGEPPQLGAYATYFKSPGALPQESLGTTLGSGHYATVYAVNFQNPLAEKPLAAKFICFSSGNGSPDAKCERALREAHVWELVCAKRSEHVVSLVETFLDTRCAVFVMERCHTTLAKHMHGLAHLDEAVVAGLLTQMLRGLQHIHACDVIHRDVKPDNVLVGEDETLKIGDFGLAVTSGDVMSGEVAGTAPYMSPEMLSKDEKVAYSTKTDVWSLGCIAYVLLMGQFPYMPKRMSGDAMKAAIREGEPAPSFKPSSVRGYSGPSDEAVAFLASTLSRDAGARPTALEALEAPYVTRKPEADNEKHPCLRGMLKRAALCGAFEDKAAILTSPPFITSSSCSGPRATS